MSDEGNLAHVMATLERAAEQLGDIVPVVMERYYAAHRDAHERFEFHDPGHRTALEGQMVTQVLYSLMTWFEPGGEIEIMLTSTIPHHVETLEIRPELFIGMLDAVCAVVRETIPPAALSERAAWEELHERVVAFATREFAELGTRSDAPHPGNGVLSTP